MIISKVIGGLGNQMFQYAIGRSLSLRFRSELKLDIADFEGYTLHQGFELNRVFNLSVAVASISDVREMLGWQASPSVQRMMKRFMPSLFHQQIICEPSFQYWPDVWKVPPHCYLSGYWQSAKYFSDIEDILRQDFSFKESMNADNAKIADKIQETYSVSLHVRRGDYVASAKTNAVHGSCTLEYYQKAIDYMSKHIDKVCFFVFSDDIPWVRDKLSISHQCHFIDFNHGKDSYRDMQLMSLCDHHIIANSTFSWWGAWLNSSSDKIVIAPEQWFAHSNCSTKDLYLPSWIIL